jgi:hypothetical protein
LWSGTSARLARDDAEGEVSGIVFGEDRGLIRVCGVVADVDGGVADGFGFGFVMSECDAAEVTAEVVFVDFEVEACFDLVGSAGGGVLRISWKDLPVVDFSGGERPLCGLAQLLVAVSAAEPAAYCVDKKDPRHVVTSFDAPS